MLIFACALNYGLEQGVVNYFFGNGTKDCVDNSIFDRDFSDSREMFELYRQYISKEIGCEITNYPLIYNRIDSILAVGQEPSVRDLVKSCILPVRYQKSMRLNNIKKYGIELPPNMCGSCRKCCIQYLVWADLGWIEYKRDLYKHCLDFLTNKLFEDYGRKPKTYKETYIETVNEKMYETSILAKLGGKL